ncbi:MAG: HAMP domain-containing sensor histidine kinase [Candidatus Delongbacteria bacterium]|jgi:two-component sensor histidine kinase|nr:HAMP domain-containing sensor histidine kinase [Candidatus Delongbacteria bacterium]
MAKNIYNRKKRWKLLLFFVAVLIGAGSLFYTNNLMEKLSQEERKRVELWAQANKEIQKANPNQDISFIFQVLLSNKTIPVMLVDENDSIISSRNLDSAKMAVPRIRKNILEEMKRKQDPIVIELLNGNKNFIYYKDSTLLTQLYYYPFVQLAIIALFIIVSYFAFSISRKSEQNHVWLGMSRETAHQLGTPISSLMGWVEVLKLENPDSPTLKEVEKDVKRLEKVAERFSKIGSQPSLSPVKLKDSLEESVAYLQSRSSKKISFSINFAADPDLVVEINKNLFEWVIENLCKNAIDAMGGEGNLEINVSASDNQVYIDVSDQGKSIPKSRQKTIFNPGYTTKERGWGLGLSLSKRIIESYHKGKIFVKHSDPKSGTTIRIILKKSNKH